MNNRKQTADRAVACVLALSAAALGACESQSYSDRMERAGTAYNSGDYETAYRDGSVVARNAGGDLGEAGAFVAGTAAYKKGDMHSAVIYLQQAVRSNDPAVVGNAGATLGMAYADLGWYDASANALLHAADHLSGEDQARAYFYAAIAQQRLGRWAQARTNLILARGATADEAFQEKCNQQLRVTGYTLRTGEFHSTADAEQASAQLEQRSLPLEIGKTRVTSTQREGRTVVQVQVGEFSSFDSARQARARLGEKHAVIMPIVQDTAPPSEPVSN